MSSLLALLANGVKDRGISVQKLAVPVQGRLVQLIQVKEELSAFLVKIVE